MKNKVGMYRFYNCDLCKHGDYFALCEKHAKEMIVPQNCVLEKIVENANLQQCIECEEEK